MHSPREMKGHLEHRCSILDAYINERGRVSRNGYNCYIDATQITCRSLWALLGVTSSSYDETDLVNPTVIKLKFTRFTEIRKHIDPSVIIREFKNDHELKALDEYDDLLRVLAGADKCVAHFTGTLTHGVSDMVLERVARRTLSEIKDRISIPPVA